MPDQNPSNPQAPSYVKMDEVQICNDEYERFLFYLTNGHIDYVDQVNRNFRYVWGSGGQWTDEDRHYFEKTLKRKTVEDNRILPAVQSATGEQIFSRSDIILKPRKGQASLRRLPRSSPRSSWRSRRTMGITEKKRRCGKTGW